MHRLTSFGLTLVASVALAGPAYAQESAEDAYGGAGQLPATVVTPSDAVQVQGATATQPAAGQPVSSVAPTATQSAPVAAATPTNTVGNGKLPFTGFDLALIALGGLALVGVGFGMRHVSRPVAS